VNIGLSFISNDTLLDDAFGTQVDIFGMGGGPLSISNSGILDSSSFSLGEERFG